MKETALASLLCPKSIIGIFILKKEEKKINSDKKTDFYEKTNRKSSSDKRFLTLNSNIGVPVVQYAVSQSQFVFLSFLVCANGFECLKFQ